MNTNHKYGKPTRRLLIMPVVLTLVIILAAAAYGVTDLMQQSRGKAQQFKAGFPPASWEHPFEYEDADIVQFVTDDLLLIGAVDNDSNYWPVYGPLFLYDLRARSEKWRVDRKRSPEAVHEIFSTRPLIILRTTSGRKVTYQAMNIENGKVQWNYKHGSDSITEAGDYDRKGLKNVYVLSGTALLSISARDGSVLWKAKTPSADAGAKQRLIATPGFVYVIGSRHVTAFKASDGGRLWEGPQSAGEPFEAAVSLDGIFVYSAGQAVAYMAQTGESRWTWKPGGGVIKLMTETPNQVYAVVQHPGKHSDDIAALDRTGARRIWQASLSGYAASPLVAREGRVYVTVGHLEEKTMGMVDDPKQMLVYTARRDLVGLSVDTGKAFLDMELPAGVKDAGNWFYPPQLDQIAIRDGLLHVARDDYGIMAIDRVSGAVAWDQPRKFPQSTYAKGVQLLGLFDKVTIDSYKPGGINSFTAPRPSYQHSMIQANNEANIEAANRVLNNPGATAADRDMARLTKEIYTSAEMNRQMIDSSFQQAQAGADLAFSIMALGNVFEQVRQQQVHVSKKSAFHNGMLSVRFGTWEHNTALSSRYCLQAYPQLVTVIDLSSGKRCDLDITPVPATGHADKATAAISPAGKWLAAVGVGLNTDSYTPIKKRGMILPNSSVVLYDIAALPFNGHKSDHKADKSVARVKSAKASPNIGFMAAGGNYQGMRDSLTKGGDPNEMFANMTPLTLAASRGDKEMVALLLSFGADVNMKNKVAGGSSTVYDVLINVPDENDRREIRDMLDRAARGILPPKP